MSKHRVASAPCHRKGAQQWHPARREGVPVQRPLGARRAQLEQPSGDSAAGSRRAGRPAEGRAARGGGGEFAGRCARYDDEGRDEEKKVAKVKWIGNRRDLPGQVSGINQSAAGGRRDTRGDR